MSNLSIAVEVKPGVSFHSATLDMSTLASILGVDVRTVFNGNNLVMSPCIDNESVCGSYTENQGKESDH